MMEGLPGIMNLAAASGEDLGAVSDIVTDGLTAFGLKAKDSAHFADVLAQTSSNANTDVSGLGEAFKYAAPVAGALGYSIEDTSIAIGLMSNAGIKGEKSGTALRTMFTNLAKPTKAMANQMEDLGLSITDSNGEMLPMRDIMDKMRSSFKNLSKDQQASAAATIFGKEAMSGALAIINASDEDYQKLTKSIDGSSGAAKRMSDTMEGGVGGKLRTLRSQIEELALTLYDYLQPAISKTLDIFSGMVTAITNIPKPLQLMAVGFAAIAAALGPALLVAGMFTSSIGSMMTVFGPLITGVVKAGGGFAFLSTKMAPILTKFPILQSVFTGLTGPIGIAVAAITALGVAFVIAYKKSETFRNIVNGVVNAIKQTFMNFLTFIQPFTDGIVNTFKSIVGAISAFATQIGNQISAFWNKNGAEIKQALTNIFNVFKTIFMAIYTVINTVFNTLIIPIIKVGMKVIQTVMSVVWTLVKALVVSTWNNIKGVIQGALKIILGVVKIFSSLFTGNWKGLWQGVKQVTKGTVQLIWNLINLWFVGKILGTVRVFGGLFKGLFSGIWNTVKKIFTTALSAVFNSSKRSFTNIFNIGKSIFNALKNFFSSIWNAIKGVFTSSLKNIWNGVRNNFNRIFNFGRDTFTKLKNTMSNLWNGIKDNTIGKAQAMKDKVTGIFKSMGSGIKGHIDTIKGHIGGMTKNVKKGLNNLISGVNWVGGKLGMDKIPEMKLSTGTGSLTKNGKLAQDTFATVGDKGRGNGPNGFRHEMIRYPNGKTVLTPDKDTKAFLPRGSEVFNGAQTHAMFSNGTFPRFHKGTGTKAKKGDNIFSDVVNGGKAVTGKVVDGGKAVVNKTLETAAKGKEWLSDKIGDVMDWIDDPAKLLEKVLEGFGIDMSSFGIPKAASLPFDMMKGMFKKLKDGAIKTFKSWFDEQGGDGGYIDLAKGINFPFSPNGRAPGYPFPQPHMGVDLNYVYDKLYSVMGGKATARSGYNGGFGNMVDIVKGNMKVIYGHMSKHAFKGSKDVKPGDYLGVSGDTGMSSGPHLHLEVQKNGVPIDPIPWLKKNNGGGTSGKWNGDIKKALKLAGLPTTSAYVNAWKQQIQTESGGNPKAIGGDDGLADGKAMGLVQVKPGTFSAYKLPGHGNIMNGLDNLIAGMRYAKARYGSSMLSVIGKGHGYATGGLIKNAGWYNIAEGGYPEWVISTDPKYASQSMMMLAMAANQIRGNKTAGNKRPSQLSNSSIGSSNNDALLFQMIQQQQEQIALLAEIVRSNQQIADKDFTIDKYEHKKQVFEGIDEYNRQKSRKSQFRPSFA